MSAQSYSRSTSRDHVIARYPTRHEAAEDDALARLQIYLRTRVTLTSDPKADLFMSLLHGSLVPSGIKISRSQLW